MIKKTLQNSSGKSFKKSETENDYIGNNEDIKKHTENKNDKNDNDLPKLFKKYDCHDDANIFCDIENNNDTIMNGNKNNTQKKYKSHHTSPDSINIKKKGKNSSIKLYCSQCNYHTNRVGDYNKHLKTIKHISNNKKCVSQTYDCVCGKSYKFQSGYSRHKQKCVYHKTEPNVEIVQTDKSTSVVTILREMMNENKKLHEQMMTIHNENNTTLRTMIPKIGNTTNSHNKIVNVQMFLQEKCQDAMTIQNFADQLMVSMDDLVKNKKDCITNVVLKNLKPLSLTERPFHCANAKSKEWYIKDETQGWEEDNGEKLIKNTEAGIQRKWLDEFESLYPNWMSNESLQEKYVKIAGSTTYELPEMMKLKILKELGREVPLTKKDIRID